MINWASSKLRNFPLQKYCWQSTEWEEIFVNYTSVEQLASKIYKLLSKHSKEIDSIKNGNDLETLTKKICGWQPHV